MTLGDQLMPAFGLPLRRVEDARLVTGQGCYVDDLCPPGTLALAILRSPYPHARIRATDLAAVRLAPGVVDVIAGAETAHLAYLNVARSVPEMQVPQHLPLAVERVRYVGDEVVAVLAETRARARDALDLIDVEYEPLDAVADVETAIRPGGPLVHAEFGSNVCFRQAYGDPPETVDVAMQRADRIVSLRIQHSRVAPVSIEPRGVLAQYDPVERTLRVWTSTQRPFAIRADLAVLLGLAPEQVRVIAPDVGGAFGGKASLYREEVLAAYLAVKHAPRPVRWVATRAEEMLTTMHGRDQVDVVDGGFSRAGDLLAVRASVLANLGAYLQVNSARPPTRTARLICGAYRVPVAGAEVVAAFTNTTPTGPYRGAGRPEGAFVIERLMDRAARELGLDPVEIRRRNFIRPAEFPWHTPTGLVYDSGDYPRTLDRALGLANYADLERQREHARAGGELFGIGLSTFVEPSAGEWESGRVRVEPDGTVIAASGSSTQGQGHRTALAQIVASRLQVPFDRVALQQGDTADAPSGIGTFGSRSAALGGAALARSADAVLAQMKRVAAALLEVAADDVVFDRGAFSPAGVAKTSVSFAEVAAAAYDPARAVDGATPGLEVTDRFHESGELYSHGTHIAAVRIDRATGAVRLESIVAVDDAGVLINPMLAEGQVLGGLAQGVGQALFERLEYAADGTLTTGTLGDYSVPRASDVPRFVLGETQTPSPLNPLGVKGVGEGGAVGVPPAIVNAVLDALAPLGVVDHLDMPLTSETVWRVLEQAGGRVAGPGQSGNNLI